MNTPLTPSTFAQPSLVSQNSGVRHPAGFGAALRATGAALQWRLLLWWTLLLLLPAAVAALPVWQMLAANFDHSLYAARLAERLDLVTIADLMTGVGDKYGTGLGAGAGVALVMTLLASPLLTGMTVAAARAPERLGFMALLAGGAAEYARMFRMLIWAVVPLAIAFGLASVAFHFSDRTAETAILETDASRAARWAMLAAVLLLLLAQATLDIGRAVLAADRRRRSAFLAWCAGFRVLLRRPLALLGIYFVITLVGLIVAALLALARAHVPALGGGGTVAAFVLAQLVIVVLGFVRSARLFALLALVR
jgi:hypothetical protein